MNIVNLKIKDLKPYSKNAKKHDDVQIGNVAESIKQFGMVQPIVVDKDNVVIIGHCRLEACKKLKYKEVPCVKADELSEEQVAKLRLLDNKLNESDWDFDLLGEELFDLDMSDFELDWNIEECCDKTNHNMNVGEKKQINYFSNEEIKQDIVDGWKVYKNINSFIENIIDTPTAKWQFNRLCGGYKDGYNISLLFNPHRLLTETKAKKSIFYGFNNDVKYKKSFARYMIETQNKCYVKSGYHRLVSIGTAGYQYVNEFQPYLARDIYKQYCQDGYKILNQCAGWGGRLIGLASCMFKDIEYVETDPQTQTFNGLVKLKEFLRLDDNYKQYNLPFEDLNLQENYFDFAFTSPPYFDTEHYSSENTQSYVRNNTYEEWKEKFLYVLIDKTMYALKKGGKCILNVGNKKYPISNDIKKYLKHKYKIECDLLDYSLDAESEEAIRTSAEDFILFTK